MTWRSGVFIAFVTPLWTRRTPYYLRNGCLARGWWLYPSFGVLNFITPTITIPLNMYTGIVSLAQVPNNSSKRPILITLSYILILLFLLYRSTYVCISSDGSLLFSLNGLFVLLNFFSLHRYNLRIILSVGYASVSYFVLIGPCWQTTTVHQQRWRTHSEVMLNCTFIKSTKTN